MIEKPKLHTDTPCYEPYGPEWERAMMDLPKESIIAMMRNKGESEDILLKQKMRLVEALKPLCDERTNTPFSLNQIADKCRVSGAIGAAKVLDKYSEVARLVLKAVGEEV